MPADLRRLLATLVAAIPLLAGTDPCTVGALIGRASVVCVGRAEAVLACAAQAAPPACPYCRPAAPSSRYPLPRGETCCDLKPLAPGAAQQPSLGAPAPAGHPAAAFFTDLPAPAPTWRGRIVLAAAGPPRFESPPPSLPRAPPLS